MQPQTNGIATVVDSLIQNTAQPDTRSFRELANEWELCTPSLTALP